MRVVELRSLDIRFSDRQPSFDDLFCIALEGEVSGFPFAGTFTVEVCDTMLEVYIIEHQIAYLRDTQTVIQFETDYNIFERILREFQQSYSSSVFPMML